MMHPSWQEYLLIIAGSLLQALGLQIFLVPANLVSGGVSGIAQLIHFYLGWPIGLMVLLGNLPLFVLGWRFLGGRRFALRTALTIVAFSFFTDAALYLPFFPSHGLTDDLLLNALYGAVISGLGFGLVYRGQGTSGGSDILARILNHWRSIPISTSYLLVDSIVILAAGLVFGWTRALYALIYLYVSGLVAEAVVEGGQVVRMAWIITGQPGLVAERILRELNRGVTLLNGVGAYTGDERTMLYCVISRPEIARIKAIVYQADPQAFMVIGQAHEALGEGFRPLEQKI